jgi:hypothetical protein
MRSVLSAADANAMFGSQTVRHRVDTGRWQRPARGVVVCHNGPLSEAERDEVALAASSPGAALAGITALRLDGFNGPAPSSRFVVVPLGSRARQVPGVVVHWSSELTPLDVHPHREPRHTRPARSVVDAATWSGAPRRARWLVIAAVQQGITTPAQIRDALSRRGRCRHRGIILESTFDAEGGKHSLPERDFARLWSALQLPPLEYQRAVPARDGTYYLDAWCPHLGFGVEVHGLPHREVANWDADVTRANEVVIGGRQLLSFTSFAIRHEPIAVADQLQRMAATRDWAPRIDEPTLRGLLRPKRRYVA